MSDPTRLCGRPAAGRREEAEARWGSGREGKPPAESCPWRAFGAVIERSKFRFQRDERESADNSLISGKGEGMPSTVVRTGDGTVWLETNTSAISHCSGRAWQACLQETKLTL